MNDARLKAAKDAAATFALLAYPARVVALSYLYDTMAAVPVDELAAEADVEATAIQRALSALRAEALVTTQPDSRPQRWRITERGVKLYERLEQVLP